MNPDPPTPTPRHSTREIVHDAMSYRAFGHNPSWVKAADYDALAARLAQLEQEQATLRLDVEIYKRQAEERQVAMRAAIDQQLTHYEHRRAAEAALGEIRQALQQMTEKYETLLARVGGECLSDRQDLPRKSRTGEPDAAERTE